MNSKLPAFFISVIFLVPLSACNLIPVKTIQSSVEDNEVDKLFVYSDGSMKFNDRFVSVKNVVIYPDGFGGERAAVKMNVPLHPDFYRDSIHVVRTDDDPVR